MQAVKVISFHPTTQPTFRVFVQKRDGFYAKDKELYVLGLSLIELNSGVFKLVPTFVFENEVILGAEDWEVNERDAVLVIVPPDIENAEDYAYAEIARILCPELDEPVSA